MTPFERNMAWLFCRSFSDVMKLVREYRYEMNFGNGIYRRVPLNGRVLVGYVFMVNLRRKPLLYMIGIPVAAFFYVLMIIYVVRMLFHH